VKAGSKAPASAPAAKRNVMFREDYVRATAMNRLLAGWNLSAGDGRERLNSIKQQYVRAGDSWVFENEQLSTTLNSICSYSSGATVTRHQL